LVYLAVGSPQVTLADKARAASLQYRNIQFINTRQNDYLCKHGIYRIIRLASDGFCLGEGGGYMVVGLDRNTFRVYYYAIKKDKYTYK
jgi:hypothetical protein